MSDISVKSNISTTTGVAEDDDFVPSTSESSQSSGHAPISSSGMGYVMDFPIIQEPTESDEEEDKDEEEGGGNQGNQDDEDDSNN